MKQVLLFLACIFSVHLFSLSNITHDTTLIWGILSKLEGERSIAPGTAPQKVKVFPRKLPLEILAKILQEAHRDTLKQLPRKACKELELRYPIFTSDPTFKHKWFPDEQLLIRLYQPMSADENHMVDIDKDTCIPLPPSSTHFYCRNNNLVYREGDHSRYDIIDQLTYNRLHQLPENTGAYEDSWRLLEPNRNWYPDFLNYAQTEYAVITQINPQTHDSQEILCVRSIKTQELLLTFPAQRHPYMFEWSKQNAFAVLRQNVEDSDFSLDVYDTTHGTPMLSYSIPIPEYNDQGKKFCTLNSLFCFCFSPGGNFLTLKINRWQSNTTSNPEIKIFDAKTGELLFNFFNYYARPSGGQIALQEAWNPDESRILLRQQFPTIFRLNAKERLLDFLQKEATILQYSLLLALMKFNFTQKDYDHIKTKFNNNIFKILEDFLDLHVAKTNKRGSAFL